MFAFPSIGNWKKHRVVEWGFIAALLIICAVLTKLQSRWTANLSQATTQQQGTQLRSGAQLFCRTFDAQINEACDQLRPGGREIESLGWEEAHIRHLRDWQTSKPRPMFRRLAIVRPEAGQARLYQLDQKTARLSSADWPSEWSELHTFVSARAAGRHLRPFEDADGLLREYPVNDGRDAGRPGRPDAIEWMVMELDPIHVQRVWLPELARACLNLDGRSLNAVQVKATDNSTIIFSNVGEEASTGKNLVSISFNSKPRGGSRDPEAEQDRFWTLRAWPRAGEFAAAVSTARTHDFVLACILDTCLLVGGLLIIHYTRRARRLGDARMQFVAAVSHELRTPLTVILAAGQNLRRGIVRDPVRLDKYADLIIDHSKQLAEMVEQVLAFAGAKRNESVLVSRPVVMERVIQQAIESCVADTLSVHCEVQVDFELGLPPVLGDASALQRVFQNLLTNAAKHGGKSGWIDVRVRHIERTFSGCVEVEVADGGAGIPTREQPHVFEPFFRGARAQADQTRGSGIGLSVVQEIVQLHRGSVRVESMVDHGTTFTVSLPVAEIKQGS